MSRENTQRTVFNRGRISKLGLGRVDLDRTLLGAEIQTNWIPRTLGSMMLRPGFEYIGTIRNSSTAILVPFVFSATDTALLELTSTALRIWQDDTLIVRSNSTAAFTNGDFSSSALTGWSDDDELGSTSAWITGGYLSLAGNQYARAKRRQQVTAVSGTHGISLKIDRGRVGLRIGSSVRGDDLFNETIFRAGHYSLAVTSTGDLFVELFANTEYRTFVDSISIESSGAMVIDTTWGANEVDDLRFVQSADVVFVAHPDHQQKRIERHGTNSWGVANYEPDDGPYRNINTGNIKLSVDKTNGETTLRADAELFRSGHAGALFRLTSVGQDVSIVTQGIEQFSDAIRVSGVGGQRTFRVLVTSTTFAGTVLAQRSVGEEGNYANSSTLVFTSTIDITYSDTLDNQISFWRIGVPTSSTGAASKITSQLIYDSGGLVGVGRVRTINSATNVTVDILKHFGSTKATDLWEEGEWSSYRGHPSAVVLHEGRLWYAGKGKIWGSVSDAFESFDPDTEGDSGPLNRVIASGGVDRIPWLASLGRLIVGTDRGELQVKTGSLDEPLTPTNFNLRDVSNQGVANVAALKVDTGALFVQRGGTRLMNTAFAETALDYRTVELTDLVPEIGEPSISRLAVQRQPDTRVHCVRASSIGTVGLLVTEPVERVSAWIDIVSTAQNGAIEEVAVLPGDVEDQVYYIVRREVNGTTQRFLEKWSRESQGRGGSSNRLADSHVVYNGTAATVIPATHLVGSSVIAWGATADLGSYTVSSTGSITLTQAATYACVGLPYEAWLKSVKLAYAGKLGTALAQRKRVNHLGLSLAYYHSQGLQYGPSTNSTDLDPLPLVRRGSTISTDEVFEDSDEEAIEFNGTWDVDSRIVLRAVAPRPCTVLGAVFHLDTKDKK